MLSAGYRMIVIIGMWLAVGISLFSMGIYGAETGHDIGRLFILTILITTVATLVLAGALPGLSFESSEQEKAKRRSDDKLSLLMELMDEDERFAFKEVLKQRMLDPGIDDGELASGIELLDALEQQNSKYQHSR